MTTKRKEHPANKPFQELVDDAERLHRSTGKFWIVAETPHSHGLIRRVLSADYTGTPCIDMVYISKGI